LQFRKLLIRIAWSYQSSGHFFMPQNKVQVPRISDAVAASLERRILEGSLKPGDRLPPERELAVELGVSRPSLREAIQKLSSKGMVQSRQGGGTYVTDRLELRMTDVEQVGGKNASLGEMISQLAERARAGRLCHHGRCLPRVPGARRPGRPHQRRARRARCR
jgi:DNA-binding transcriptional regulator YhcF (GntR family)